MKKAMVSWARWWRIWMRLNGFSWFFYCRISLNIETNHVLVCVSGCWSPIQEVSGLPMDPHSHMAHWYCQYSVFLWFHTSNICCPEKRSTLCFYLSDKGWGGVSFDTVRTLWPLVPLRVLWLYSRAGGPVSTQCPIWQLLDELPYVTAHWAV